MKKNDLRAYLALILGFCLFALAPQAVRADEYVETSANVEEIDVDFLADFEDEFGDEEEDTAPSQGIADPLKYWNVMWFQFNDKVYFWVMKPVSKVYAFVLPEAPRKGIRNFFKNLGMPGRFFNCLFQGRLKGSGIELARFGVNTTVGLLGLFDPAHHWLDLKAQNRDGDQTLAKARIGKGIYLTWPAFGPSSIRGTFGLAIDTVLNPATFLPGIGAFAKINNISLGEDHYESVIEASINPYVGIRDGYVQYRNQKAEE